MTKPRLVKVRALFCVLQQVIKRGYAYFDTASYICVLVLSSNSTRFNRTLPHILFGNLRPAHDNVYALRRRGHTHALKVVVNGGGIRTVGCNTFKPG